MVNFSTWSEWHAWVRRSYIRYDAAPIPFDTAPITHSQMEDFLWRANCRSRATCEAIIKRTAETRRWPTSASEHAYFLARRLEYAMELLSVLGGHGRDAAAVDPPHAPPQTILPWLLIDAWETCGWRRWVDQLLAGHEKKIGLRA